MRRLLQALIIATVLAGPAMAQLSVPAPPAADPATTTRRAIILTDIGNEPDDQMSFVRLLLYSNEIDLEGIIATTSTWQRTVNSPGILRQIVADYGTVRPNLLKHANGWPTAAALNARITVGQPGYGMPAVGRGLASPGSTAIITAADNPDPRPLWISIWGGANTLAQALIDARATRTPAALATLIAKLRVVATSDQDDAGPWIRREFPGLFYVVQPSTTDAADYADATWTGISGDVFYRNGEGADFTTVTNEWLDANIRAKGPLGRRYPRYMFIMEGDTPDFLNLIGNGLESYRSPSWGGWGGRYIFRQPYGETRAMWTQGGDSSARITSKDDVVGIDGARHVSNQATIWRWRTAFQNDFAARMDWTVRSPAEANHPPEVVVNGSAGRGVIEIAMAAGATARLDAAASHDPDGQRLSYKWFVYPEAGFSPGVAMADVGLDGADGAVATVTAKSACRAQWLPPRSPDQCRQGQAHVILAVTDNGSPPLTSYRRVIITVHDEAAAPGGAPQR